MFIGRYKIFYIFSLYNVRIKLGIYLTNVLQLSNGLKIKEFNFKWISKWTFVQQNVSFFKIKNNYCLAFLF